jgi:hypothetical protein
MRGKCWRSSASTIRRSKPPTPPCRARLFWGPRLGRRPRRLGHPPTARRGSGDSLSGPRHRPRPGARGQQPARRCAPSSSRPSARSPASASSMSAPARVIIARSWPNWSGHPAGSRRSSSTPRWPSGLRASFPAARTCASSATTAPETPADGVYVNFAVSRPADRWVDGLSPGGRLVFPLGVPGPQRPNSGGRHSDRGARDQHGLFC